MAVFALQKAEKIVVKFKAEKHSLFDKRLAGILQKNEIGVVTAYETKKQLLISMLEKMGG